MDKPVFEDVPWQYANVFLFHKRLDEALTQMHRAWRIGAVERVLTEAQNVYNQTAPVLSKDKTAKLIRYLEIAEAKINASKFNPTQERKLIGEAAEILNKQLVPLLYEALHEAHLLLPAKFRSPDITQLARKLGMSPKPKKNKEKEVGREE